MQQVAGLGAIGARRSSNPRSMPGIRPVAQLIGLHIAVLGLTMLLPFAIDLADGNPNAQGMLISAVLTAVAGVAIAVASWRRDSAGLSRPQAFLLTVGVWTVLPAFGALPFIFGAPFAGFTDAYFEAMSGFTTTGSTVFTDLDQLPRGVLLWRSLLCWFGGLGIVTVALVFLPAMRIGGMQFFEAVSLDVSGDTIPQATRVAADLLRFYLVLTALCVLAFAAAGMSVFDAIAHALPTVSTGGFATSDASFARFGPAAQYACIVFMALGAMPFIRFIELGRGRPAPLWRDTQIRAFLGIVAVAAGSVAAAEILVNGMSVESAVRGALFNIMSVITTTGFATADYWLWTEFSVAVFFIVAMIGGCSGSTTGAAKVFRLQMLYSTLLVQIRRILNPHGVFPLRYQGRSVEPDVVSSVMAFLFIYLSTIGVIAILLSLMGLDFVTALTAPIATVTNVGPGLGPVIGPAGNFSSLPDAAKWLLSLGMLLGRLEFLSVLVLLTPAFWRQ